MRDFTKYAAAGLMVGAVFAFVIYNDRAEAGVGPGYSDSFTVDCGTSPTEIRAPSGGMYSYVCQNSSATEVFVGDSSLTTATAPKYCDGCAGQEFGGNVKLEYCRVAAGTVTVACRAMVGSAP